MIKTKKYWKFLIIILINFYRFREYPIKIISSCGFNNDVLVGIS